jgi:outer membrane protein assembly factor BamB
MDTETKIKTAHRAALVSGIFCGVVALLLLLNFWHMKQNEPLESAAMEALLQRLQQEPNNEELQREIRNFDLLARKAYFTSRWQVKTGTYLLLFGGIVLAISLKVYTDLRSRIEKPEEVTEELLRARANTQYWLFLAGGLVFGLAVVASFMSRDYLADYRQRVVAEAPAPEGEGVEVIQVFPSGQSPADADSAGTEGRPEDAGGREEGTGATQAGRGIAGHPGSETAAGAGAPAPEATEAGAAGTPAYYGKEAFRENQATFRGFFGQGISYHKNIPVSWNGSTGENIKWKVAYSKPGSSSPVIWGDRLFISGGDEQARVVSCYDRHSGQLLWERKADNIPGSPSTMPRVTDDTGLAAPTMAVDGHRVYAIFATGDVIAFDLDGHRVWARNLGVPDNHYGHSSSLQVWKNRLVIQYDTNARGRMLALDTATGETIWDVNRPVHISWASPVLIEVDGRMEIVTTADPYVSGHDLETGRELWKVDAMMGEVGPSVAYDGGLVFATNEYARLVAVEPKPGATILWQDDEYLSEASSPVAHGGLLYLATSYGVLVCYGAKTGEKVWEKEFNDGFYSSPVIADGKVYITDMDGVTHILKADRTGTLIGEPALGEGAYATPVFAEGAVYLKGFEHLFCVGD